MPALIGASQIAAVMGPFIIDFVDIESLLKAFGKSCSVQIIASSTSLSNAGDLPSGFTGTIQHLQKKLIWSKICCQRLKQFPLRA